MFSSQGQVSSKIITFLVDREKSNIFGRRVETAKNTDTANIPSKPNCKFQPEAECNMPRKLLRGAVLGFFPSLTKSMKLISDDLFGLHDERNFQYHFQFTKDFIMSKTKTTLMECNFTGS